MPNPILRRGAFASPRHELAAAIPHIALANIPPNFIRIPKQLSMWLNDQYGDCVTAEEAFAKACNSPEIFISDTEVLARATAGGWLNGANLIDVLRAMQTAGFQQGGENYNDGAPTSVNWTDPAILQSAIYNGPVKIAVAADQLQTAVEANGISNGWFGVGFKIDQNTDHCVSLCGYGSIGWLAQQIGVSVLVA